MPITRLRHGDAPYTMLPVDTVQAIADPTALAIWCYLQSQPEDWIVHQTQICEHFRIGKDKCQRAVKKLRDAWLWTEEVEKGENGKITGRTVTIHYQPTVCLKNRQTEKPSDGKPAATKEEYIQNKKSNKISTSAKPDFISSSVWDRWFAYRCERRLPMTNTASRMLVAKLEKARAAGATPAELESEIDAAIERGWRTIYPAALKEKPKQEKQWL